MEDKLKMVQTLVEKDDELKNVDDRYTKVQANNHRFEWSGKQLDILLRRVAEGTFSGGGFAFEDYTSGGGKKTKEEFLPAFVESVDNSELFFILPEDTQFPYVLTEEDKEKLKKATFLIVQGTTYNTIFNRGHGINNKDYIGYWYSLASNSQVLRMYLSSSQIQSIDVNTLSDIGSIKFISQSLNDGQKTQARTNIDAEKATIVENVEGAEATLDVKGGRKYMCGELTSLTINSIEKSTDTTVIYFTSGATPTQFVYPEDTPISGWDQPEANKIYLICIFNGNLSIEPYE